MVQSDFYILFLRIMTREEKITAIYKEIANKELTFGCRCVIKAQEPDGEDFLYRLCR